MKRFILALLAAVLLMALAVPATSVAKPHHKLQGCPKGKHHPRKPKPPGGRYHKCVKNRVVKNGNNGNNGANGPGGNNGANGNNGKNAPPPPPPATFETSYDNILSVTENPVSLGYEATGTSEFGSQILLAGNNPFTRNPEIQVQMSSWACQSGEWNNGCSSAPGSTFNAPLTLRIYEVGSNNAVGGLLFIQSKTFAIPFRPDASAFCDPDGVGPEKPTQYLNVNGKCRNGFPKIVTFSLNGNLPNKFILSVAYNTRDYGNPPTGVSSPMDALNVGLEGPATKGSNPTESQSGVYWASKTFSDKTGIFHYTEEPSEWPVGESQIAAHIVTHK